VTRIFDCFLFCDELDLLECRLREHEDVPDLMHVLVEADRTHGGNAMKPFVFLDNRERFRKWNDRIWWHGTVFGSMAMANPWEREHAQREQFAVPLERGEVQPEDLVMQSDVDEIPDVAAIERVHHDLSNGQVVVLEQRPHYLALDWQHPDIWPGTTVTRGLPASFAAMRHARFTAPRIADGGWHLSWLGGPDAVAAKIARGCHPEFEGFDAEAGVLEGIHVDGKKMFRHPDSAMGVTYPRWVREGDAPAAWYREYWLERERVADERHYARIEMQERTAWDTQPWEEQT
jgi:beta-1,4-mannosyl-glycoprotein beta-1,4-N-acetylglucosaminyltransferase